MYLVAAGQHHDNHQAGSWVRPLPKYHQSSYGVPAAVVIGRDGADWNVPWDHTISRQHATITAAQGGAWLVEKLPSATNPVFFRGRAQSSFSISVGENFVIGKTRFRCVASPTSGVNSGADVGGGGVSIDGRTFDDATMSAASIEGNSAAVMARQLDALERLPMLLDGAIDWEQAIVRVASLVRPLMPSIDAIAAMSVAADDPSPQWIFEDDYAPAAANHQPFADVAWRVLDCGQSVLLNISSATDGLVATDRWAAGVPIGWIDGRLALWAIAGAADRAPASASMIRPLMKFLSVASRMIETWHTSRRSIRQQATMARFFSPPVLADLQHRGGDDPLRNWIRPVAAELVVLFFDLRQFTTWTNAHAEAGELSTMMDRLHETMSLVTGMILAGGGVVGDFHGDAVMGFWGWPPPRSGQPNIDGAQAAVATALAIQSRFAASPRPMAGGIGIASGMAMAGGIGSDDQLKVTAIGPAVNLAARLEANTRNFEHAIIVASETVAKLNREFLPPHRATALPPMKIRGWRDDVDAVGFDPLATVDTSK